MVDDEPAIRSLLERTLRGAEHRVSLAADAFEAKRILTADTRIEVLVTDFVMPGMDGVALAEWSARERPDVGVLMMSAHPLRKHVAALSPRPRTLQKPFTLEELLEAVRAVHARSPLGKQAGGA